MSLQGLLVETLEQYRDNPKVFAIDIGRRFEGETRTEENCVRLHLQKALEPAEKPQQAKVQELTFRMEALDQIGQHSADPNPKIGRREIQSGLSIGCFLPSGLKTVGTIGLIGFDRRKKDQLSLLTCYHVVPGKMNTWVTQPGPYLDGGLIFGHIIGKLSRFDPNGDAALIHLFPRRNNPVRTKVVPNFQVFKTQDRIQGLRKVQLGDVLSKSGRTTGITEAQVDGIGYFFKPSRGGRPRIPIPAFRLVPVDPSNANGIEISMVGDSGAVWYDKNTKEGVGLLFAGEERKIPHTMEFSWAQHLTDVFERLNFSLTRSK